MPDRKILKVKEHPLVDGDSFGSIALDNGLSKKELMEFNIGTDSEEELKKYLRGRFGCKELYPDGRFKFEASDTPGIIFIPEKETTYKYAAESTHEVKLKIPKIKIEPEAKCVVYIRPHAAWKGEFGFDWVRLGETGSPGDLDYMENMSVRTPKNDLINLYDCPVIPKAQDNGKATQGFTSYLNLFPKDECPNQPHEADLRAYIDLRGGKPAFIIFECDFPDFEDYITIVKELPKSAGWHPFKVSCKKAFDTDLEIKVINQTNDSYGKEEKIVVGKLIIPKNDKANRHSLNVVFIPVWTNINGPVKRILSDYIGNMKTLLKRDCEQSLLTPNFAVQKFDLTAGFFSKFKLKLKRTFNMSLNILEQINSEWVITNPVGDGTLVFFTDAHDRLHTDGSRVMIHDNLYDAFKKKFKKYEEYYLVFMFDELGYAIDAPTPPGVNENFVGLNGAANGIPGKSVVVFGRQDASTTSHELFHALGLSHPFDDGSLLTFKNHGVGGDTYCKTDNLMDYSHFVNIEMFQTWFWQWKIMQNAVKNKTWP